MHLLARLGSLALLSAALLSAPNSRAQEARYLTFENDGWFDTDRYYTNGIQLSARHPGDARSPRMRVWLDGACRWFGCAGDRLLYTQNSFGQLMYTPGDITVAASQPRDRPYAGLLYLQRDYVFLSADGQVLTTLGLQGGVTGPMSLAEPAQKLVHRVLDRPPPRGWEHQVGNTLALALSAERRVARPGLSGMLGDEVQLRTATYWRAGVGNLMSYAAGGIMFTIGKDLPPVAPLPSGIGHRLGASRACVWDWVECSAWAGLEARWMAYNLFLQGRPWRRDPQVRPRRWVADLSTGTRLDFPHTRGPGNGPWFMQIAVTRRTAEFHEQVLARRHTVAALTLGTAF